MSSRSALGHTTGESLPPSPVSSLKIAVPLARVSSGSSQRLATVAAPRSTASQQDEKAICKQVLNFQAGHAQRALRYGAMRLPIASVSLTDSFATLPQLVPPLSKVPATWK